MFKMKNGVMNNAQFFGALRDLGNQKLPAKVAWNISRTLRKIENAEKDVRQSIQNLGKVIFVCDVQGNFAPMKDQEGNNIPGKWLEAEEGANDKFEKFVDELLEIEVEIESEKIKIEDLEGTQLSPITLSILEPIIAE